MLRFVKKLAKGVLIGVGLLIVFLVIWYVIAQARYKSLATNVERYMTDEFEKLQLADEITELRHESNNGCYYGYKTGSTDCSIRYTRYYVSEAVPVEEFKMIDKHVRELGWTDWGYRETEEEINRKFEKGIATFGIYTLHGKYKIDMHVDFYSEVDKDHLNETIRSFVNEYVDEYSTIYRVSIDADI